MSWADQLTGSVIPPRWKGTSELHLKLSDAEANSQDDTGDLEEPVCTETHVVCTKCNRELPATKDYFFGNRRKSNGLMAECKECHKGRMRWVKRSLRESKKVLRRGEFERLQGIEPEVKKANGPWPLSPREREILTLMVTDGTWTNKTVGIHLGISYKTVACLLCNVRKKMGESSSRKAALNYMRWEYEDHKARANERLAHKLSVLTREKFQALTQGDRR